MADTEILVECLKGTVKEWKESLVYKVDGINSRFKKQEERYTWNMRKKTHFQMVGQEQNSGMGYL